MTGLDPSSLPATAALADVLQLRGRTGWLTPPLRPFQRGEGAVLGTARTVRVLPGPGGHGLKPLHALLAEDLTGRVVVVAGADAAPGAVWGEILSVAALARGAVGALIEGSVRDVPAVTRLGLRLWALAEATAGPGGAVHVAEIGGAIRIGDTPVADGDPILLDDGGAVALSPADAAALLADALTYHQAETEVLEALTAGLHLPRAYTPKSKAITHLRNH
ncbi:RraA family protein [Embleya sp. NBC_00896]|uniref:RraA family protein n=1 Tax=Embleya sp. NBC_00896 TaxID=2975961 RepID=UPI002F914D06|nr:RraA family protein [Embleya sp. NBC_00896]